MRWGGLILIKEVVFVRFCGVVRFGDVLSVNWCEKSVFAFFSGMR